MRKHEAITIANLIGSKRIERFYPLLSVDGVNAKDAQSYQTLINALMDENSFYGFNKDWEPTRYGRYISEAIDILLSIRPLPDD